LQRFGRTRRTSLSPQRADEKPQFEDDVVSRRAADISTACNDVGGGQNQDREVDLIGTAEERFEHSLAQLKHVVRPKPNLIFAVEKLLQGFGHAKSLG
jgi:hypothetical protein